MLSMGLNSLVQIFLSELGFYYTIVENTNDHKVGYKLQLNWTWYVGSQVPFKCSSQNIISSFQARKQAGAKA